MPRSSPDECTVTDTLTVIIVDDEPLARASMRLVLDTAPDVTVCVECGDGIEADGEKRSAEQLSKQLTDTKPSHQLAAYVGTYSDPFYGTVEVKLVD